MAKSLKAGEQVMVDRTIEFDATSESFEKGLPRVEAGHVGVVIGRAPQGRASIVDFSGIEAIVSNHRLVRAPDRPLGKKRGRRKQAESAPKQSSLAKLESTNTRQSVGETSAQLITQMANTLLLNGGLRDGDDAVIQIRFAELSEPLQTQIRALIEAKLSLSGPVTK